MKKALIVIGILLCSVIGYGKLTDEIGIFNDEQKEKITEIVKEIKEKKDIDLHITTTSSDTDYVTENSEKTIIFNLKKENDSEMVIDLKISKDIELDEDKISEINGLLDTGIDYIQEEKIDEYAINVINEMEVMLKDVTITESEKDIISEDNTNNIGFNIKIGLAFFVIFVIILGVVVKRRKNK